MRAENFFLLSFYSAFGFSWNILMISTKMLNKFKLDIFYFIDIFWHILSNHNFLWFPYKKAEFLQQLFTDWIFSFLSIIFVILSWWYFYWYISLLQKVLFMEQVVKYFLTINWYQFSQKLFNKLMKTGKVIQLIVFINLKVNNFSTFLMFYSLW
jgi:hypothetical protein